MSKEQFEKHLLRNIETLRAMIGAYGTQDMADLAGDINQKMLEVTRQNKRYREALEEANRELINLYNNLLDHKVTADEAIENIELIGMNIIQDALKGDKQ